MKVFYCLGKKDFCVDEDSLCCVCTHYNDGGGEYRECEIVEAKHGEWIEKEEIYGDVYYTCSNCGEDWTTIDGTPFENGMNFCPQCGAKMDGGVNDGNL